MNLFYAVVREHTQRLGLPVSRLARLARGKGTSINNIFIVSFNLLGTERSDGSVLNLGAVYGHLEHSTEYSLTTLTSLKTLQFTLKHIRSRVPSGNADVVPLPGRRLNNRS